MSRRLPERLQDSLHRAVRDDIQRKGQTIKKLRYLVFNSLHFWMNQQTCKKVPVESCVKKTVPVCQVGSDNSFVIIILIYLHKIFSDRPQKKLVKMSQSPNVTRQRLGSHSGTVDSDVKMIKISFYFHIFDILSRCVVCCPGVNI